VPATVLGLKNPSKFVSNNRYNDCAVVQVGLLLVGDRATRHARTLSATMREVPREPRGFAGVIDGAGTSLRHLSASN
jgi:hypothetical protein